MYECFEFRNYLLSSDKINIGRLLRAPDNRFFSYKTLTQTQVKTMMK